LAAEDVVGDEEAYLASVYAAYAPYDLTSRKPITIEWDRSTALGPVHVQAQGIPGTLDEYRMYTVVDAAHSRFLWDSDFVSTQEIGHEAISVLAWTLAEVEGLEQRVHIPLSFFQDERPPPQSRYSVGIFTNTTLRGVRLTVTRAAGDGEAEFHARPLEGEYPAGAVIWFEVPELGNGGLYLGVFAATTRNNLPVNHEFWFYAPSR
jgi:hypothetical protein